MKPPLLSNNINWFKNIPKLNCETMTPGLQLNKQHVSLYYNNAGLYDLTMNHLQSNSTNAKIMNASEKCSYILPEI